MTIQVAFFDGAGGAMGEIIAFRQDARRLRKTLETPPGGAQILFFLGVRYMRMDEAMVDRLARQSIMDREHDRPGGGKRKRRARA